MKKIITLFALALCCGTAARAQTPSITNAFNEDSCSSHVFFYSLAGLSTPVSQYSMEHSFGDGTTSTQALYSPQAFWQSHAYATSGTYTVKAVLIQGSNRLDSAQQTVNALGCIFFNGLIYADFNGNCTFNYTSDVVIQSPMSIKVDSANIPIDTVMAYGGWGYTKRGGVGTPAVYKFTILNPPSTFVSTCQTGNSITVNYPSGSTSNNNFGYTCSGSGFDLSGIYNAFLRTSSAGPSWISGYVSNAGCNAQSATATFKVSPKYTINASGISPSPTTVVGNTVTWNMTGLQLGASIPFYIPLTANAVYQLGDTACNILTVTPTTGDANPANNVVSRCDSLRTAFDPNDKSVLPAGNVTAGTMLTYHINFENLGNDTAFNIHVLDTLSANLDANSFALVSASHNVRSSLIETGGLKIMKFDFPNIRLADKTKPALNKGYVRFTMKAKTGLANGTQIPNRAGIYFDFNPVVMTNTAMSTIGTPQSVNTLSPTVRNSIHPNPANERLTITNNGTLTHAVLTTVTGQVVRRWNLVVGENNVSLETLPAALYLVQLYGESGMQVEKLEKR